MKTIAILFILSLCFFFSSCKEKKQAEPVVEKPVMVNDSIEPSPLTEVEKPLRNEVQHYFLIAGCFEYKELADKLCEKLQKEGFDSKIIPYYENLYLVSYTGYATQQEAEEALNTLKHESGKEKTWIYHLKN